jgi:hypothetical protein
VILIRALNDKREIKNTITKNIMESTNSYTEGLTSLIKAIKAQIKAPNRRSRFTITRD